MSQVKFKRVKPGVYVAESQDARVRIKKVSVRWDMETVIKVWEVRVFLCNKEQKKLRTAAITLKQAKILGLEILGLETSATRGLE